MAKKKEGEDGYDPYGFDSDEEGQGGQGLCSWTKSDHCTRNFISTLLSIFCLIYFVDVVEKIKKRRSSKPSDADQAEESMDTSDTGKTTGTISDER